HTVETATIKVEEAEAAQAAAGDASATGAQFADKALDAARSQLSADQTRLTVLQAGTSTIEITRQQTRVSLLRDQAIAAATAAQPTVVLLAPFDGMVTRVGVSAGQTITGS